MRKRLWKTSLAGALGMLLWAAAPAFGSGPKSDFDGNGVVDLNDFFLFAERYGQSAGQAGFDAKFDVIGDGKIDQADFFIFAQNFGARADDAPAGPRKTFFYVADFPGNGVSVMDSATNLVLSYMPFRGPTGIAVSSDHRTTYVVDVFTFLALRDDFNVDYTLPLRDGAKVVLSPDNRRAFVTQGAANNILYIDLEKKAVSDTVAVGRAPFGIAISPDGRSLYAVNTGSGAGSLSIIDVQTRTVRDSLRLETAPGLIAVSPDGRRGYLNSAAGGRISVVDLTANRVVGTIQTGGQLVYGMAFSPDGKLLYAAASGKVVVIDVERNLITDRINVADDTGPLTVSPDGGRLYVSAFSQSGGGAAVYIVDLATKQTLGKIRGFIFPLDFAFRTSAFDVPPSRRNKPATRGDAAVRWAEREKAWRPE
ncbi:MAG: hypothetical protein A3F84_07405 [Candidatus Handelsmanbacteria bacterium RIFCSPLOWO2_12_FULL_64_10]|uniref:EF-hand domain-containing protein n=1 Tax=Handelsmanbacteria sp. (strain RIFCSPLOWO2_12_FULL_64_10) TaxID=1817868 RepID=A0A1F6CCD8_HANXR|nr:MAG: hypothetical protein A3F84_07405 [Candidatus Handelsmanbacteria bacterium RIFCSPLOWO2_12_FULL_64_10]